MTIQIEAETRALRKHPAIADAVVPWLVLALLFAAALWLRQVVAANTDVSWLLTAADKVMSGGRLYVDVIETNPPAAVLAYMPALWLAKALGVRAEIVVDGLVFAAIFASLVIVAKILKPSAVVLNDMPRWPLAWLGFAVLAILPAQTFGQREHIAVIVLLPMLAVTAQRMQQEMPPLRAVLVAGLGAAVALSFKPQFAIGLGCAVAASCVHARNWRLVLTPENLLTAALAALYLAGTVVLYPEYVTVILPLLRDVYVPVGLSLADMLDRPAISLWAMAILAAGLLGRRSGAAPWVLLSGSAGFAVVYLLQRKGWSYHSYPMLALALLGLGFGLAAYVPDGRFGRVWRGAALLLLAAIFARSMLWFDVAFDARPLQAAVARLGPYPSVLAISGEPGIGHPLVRALGGQWVSRQQGLWVATYADHLRRNGPLSPDREAALEAHAARERAMLVEDIRRTTPNVVLVDDLTGSGSAWLAAHPDVAALLKDYRLTDIINRVAILTRRD
jgi:hypothetical protein